MGSTGSMATPAPSSADPPAATGGHLSALGVAILGYTFVCGGPFGIEPVVGGLGAPLAVACCILLAIFWALPQACVTAELSTALPGLGGQVDWVHAAFGRTAGITNSWLMAFWQLVDLPTGPIVLASYCANQAPGLSSGALYGIKVSVVAIAVALNVVGIDAVTVSGALLSAVIYAPFLALPLVAAALHTPMDWGVFVSPSSLPQAWSVSIPVAISTLIWSFNGFWCLGTIATDVRGMPLVRVAGTLKLLAGGQGKENSNNTLADLHTALLAGEGVSVNEPVLEGAGVSDEITRSSSDSHVPGQTGTSTSDGARRFVVGTLLSIAMCTAGFTFPIIIGGAIAPNAADWQTGFFVSLGARVCSTMGTVMLVAAVLNSLVTFNSCIGAYSRGIQASALRGDLPLQLLGRRMTRWNTPVPALALCAGVCCVLLLGFGFDTLIVVDSSVSLAMAVFLYAAFVRLRYTHSGTQRPFMVLRAAGPVCGAWLAVAPLAVLMGLAAAVLAYQAAWGPAACVGLVVVSSVGAWAVVRCEGLRGCCCRAAQVEAA